MDEAFELVARQSEGEFEFAVPDVFWAEFGNICWNAVRRGRCLRRFADAAIADMRGRQMHTFTSFDLLPRAFDIANAYGRTVYGSLYVALAQSLATEMITADERLANALAAHLPVKWLGAI